MGTKLINSNEQGNKSVAGDAGNIVVAFAIDNREKRDIILSGIQAEQNFLLREAFSELKRTAENINQLIVSNRGGETGLHGFIAEQLEVGIGNTKSIMQGKGKIYFLLDNNGRDDFLFNGISVQMKFVQKSLCLDAIRNHMTKYPEVLQIGEIYMIPKDYWEKIQFLWQVPAEDAGKLRNTDYTLWQKLQALSDDGITSDKICAAEFGYNGAQKNTYTNTIKDCQQEIISKRNSTIRKAIVENGPSVAEVSKTIAIGAGIEGTLQGIFVIIDKYQHGIRIKDFDKTDMEDVLKTSARGVICGGIRSGVVYIVVNYTHIPAGIASGVFTIVEKTIELEVENESDSTSKEKNKEELIATVIDVSVTTLLSFAGSKYCKKNKATGAMLGTVTAKAILYAGKKIYGYFEKNVA